MSGIPNELEMGSGEIDAWLFGSPVIGASPAGVGIVSPGIGASSKGIVELSIGTEASSRSESDAPDA